MSNKFRSGFAAIVGRPNVGKSTLMNALVGEKIAIISDKPQTTRNRIQSVLTRENYQIVFVDTPGIHKPKNKLGEYMVKAAQNSLDDMEAILFVVDAADGIGYGDRMIAELLQDISSPVLLVANKMDIADVDKARKQLEELHKFGGFDDIVEISALTGANIKELEEKLVSYLPEGQNIIG